MRFKRGYLFATLALPLLILLSGCFQQAGESFTPIPNEDNSQSVGAPQDTPTALDQNALPTLGLEESSPTPEAPSDNGTTLNTPSDNGQNGQPTSSIAITIIAPTAYTGLPVTDTPESQESQPTLDLGSLTGLATPTAGQFLTPFSPLGPVTPETPVPIAPGGLAEETATPSGLITPTALPGADSANGCDHTVQPGETLFRIALKSNVTVAQLINANPQVGDGSLIHPGDVLTIPSCNGNSSTTAGSAPVPTTAPAAPVTGGTTYTVQRGDTLFAIAQRFHVTMKAIEDANNLSNPNNLSVGQQLAIPGS